MHAGGARGGVSHRGGARSAAAHHELQPHSGREAPALHVGLKIGVRAHLEANQERQGWQEAVGCGLWHVRTASAIPAYGDGALQK